MPLTFTRDTLAMLPKGVSPKGWLTWPTPRGRMTMGISLGPPQSRHSKLTQSFHIPTLLLTSKTDGTVSRALRPLRASHPCTRIIRPHKFLPLAAPHPLFLSATSAAQNRASMDPTGEIQRKRKTRTHALHVVLYRGRYVCECTITVRGVLTF